MARYRRRRAFIYFLEAWAQVVVSLAFGPYLGTHYVSFCDNEAAKHALLKGYGKDECINNMLGLFWTNFAIEGRSPWFERVTSKANLSDEISREDMTLVKKSRWHTIDLDLTITYEILIRAARGIEFAHGPAADLIAHSLRDQIKKLERCHWAHDTMSDW